MDKAERLYREANLYDEELFHVRKIRKKIIIAVSVVLVLLLVFIVFLSLMAFHVGESDEGFDEGTSLSPEVSDKDIDDYFSYPDMLQRWLNKFRFGRG